MITRLSLVVKRKRSPSRPSRFLSTQPSPSPKISVVPFRQAPQDVVTRLQTFALFASARPSNFASAALRFLSGPVGAWLSETFGFGSTSRLREMKAVYYPIWRTDVIYEGKVGQSGKKMDHHGWIGARGAYVPGNSFAPSSYLSFSVPPLEDDLAQYDPSKDLEQLGEGFEIVPVPFTASPSGLLEKMEQAVGSYPKFEGSAFDKPTWKPTLVACYPIMFPIYIADFEYEAGEGEMRSMNIVMDAHDENSKHCRISCPPTPEVAERTPRSKNNYYINPVTFVPEKDVFLPFSLTEDIFTPQDEENKKPKWIEIKAPGADLVGIYDNWMSPRPTSLTSIPPSPMVEVEVSEGGVKWDDERIQSWSGEERMENEEFFDVALEARSAEAKVQRLESMRQQSDPSTSDDRNVMVSGGPEKEKGSFQSVNEMIEAAKASQKDAERRSEEARPKWSREWVSRQEGAKQDGLKQDAAKQEADGGVKE